MPKKSFFENELNNTWREAREKGIEYGIALGHKDGTQENDRKGMLYVACEMQDIGCMDPSYIDVSVFNRWREYTMSDGNRRGKAISDTSFKKRKEAFEEGRGVEFHQFSSPAECQEKYAEELELGTDAHD